MGPDDHHVLICAPNWLGDSLMAMPAVEAYRQAHPSATLTVLAKPSLVELWQMQSAVDSVLRLAPGSLGTLRTGHALRGRFARAHIMPNSFRSALIPWVAGVAHRTGTSRHGRAALITDPVRFSAADEARHQAVEAYRILGVAPPAGAIARPHLAVASGAAAETFARLGLPASEAWLGIMPGAARGPSKRWPHPRFATAAATVCAATGAHVLVLGAPAERDLCDTLARAIGPHATSLGGRTGMSELAALLSACRVVLCNDSGGMHLAAAMGAGVVAVFGLTDPTKTGPLGRRCRVVSPEGVVGSRRIARSSGQAVAALASIRPETVAREALTVWEMGDDG